MRADHALARLHALPNQPYDIAFPDEPFAVLAPHPDDESLGCGGVIAESCARGRPPLVIILTDGTGSHPNSRLYPAHRLRALREAETVTATSQLGLPGNRLLFLRYRDTAAPNDGPALREAASRLTSILRQHGCRTLLAPWQHDPHCDHEAAASIARVACQSAGLRLLAYPVWGLTLPNEAILPDEDISGFTVDITGHLASKRAAIQAHASQYAGLIPDDPSGFQMTPHFIQRFLGNSEVFLNVLPACEAHP